MTQGVRASCLRDAGLEPGIFDGLLENRFVEVMPAPLSCHPVGVMAAPLEVLFMLAFHGLQLLQERFLGKSGEHRVAILVALAGANNNLIPRKIDILDSKTTTLHEPQSCPVQQHRHQPGRAIDTVEHSLHFLFGKHNGQPARSLGANNSLNETDLLRSKTSL
jgi:hypothetical protein